MIAHAKYLFGSRKLLGSITIISNRCFSPWSVLNHLGKVHFDPFWSFCVFPPNCVFVFATVSGTHTCIQYLTLLVWSSLEDGNVQEAPEITSFLPELRLPKGLDKGCPKCNVMYTPSSNFCQQYLGWLTRATRFGNVKFCQCALHRSIYIHTYNVSSLYWSYNSASKWRATNIGDYFGLSWVCIACFGPWSRKSRRYVWHCPGQLWQEARVAAADWHAYATGQSFAAHSKDLQSFLWTCAKVSHRLNLPKCGWWQCKKSCMKGIHTGVDSDPKMIKHVH